jgi:hypothetical protein
MHNIVTEPVAPRLSLSDALQLWIEISGVDPSSKSWTMGQLSTLDLHRALKDALELDDTEITGLMLFDYVANIYMSERNFSVETLIEEPQRVASYLSKCRELRSFLRDERITSIVDDFTEKMVGAVAKYGADNDAVLQLIKDRHQLALLRRDAMRTMKHLEVHQFLDGNPEPEGVMPGYGRFVYQWENINSMLAAMVGTKSGITVNLIRNPVDPFQSYFAFGIRNGGKLFVFTDREKLPHPIAAELYHRPEKILAERSTRNWFPYDLAGLAFNEEGKAYIKPSSEKNLVAYQATALPIKAISELDAPEVVWMTMMLDLIVEKFWKQEFRAPELSYTGEMIKISTPLIEAAKSANLPVPVYHALELKPLTVADVQSENVGEDVVGSMGKQDNKWLEDRYLHLVTDDGFNLVASPEVKMIKMVTPEGKLAEVSVVDPNAKDRGPYIDREKLAASRLEMKIMDASSFATADQLDKDRRFMARHNFAQQIDKFAEIEFNARHKEVIKWVQEKIYANIENLLPMMAHPEIHVECEELRGMGNRGAYGWRDGTKRRLVDRVSLVGEDNAWRVKYLYQLYGTGKIVFRGTKDNGPRPLCFRSNASASWYVQFTPETTAELAMLCGCEISDLPDVLQHWTMVRHDAGNQILNRVDPMDWACHNPWQDLQFVTTFFLSASELKRIEKQYSKVGFRTPTPIIR